MRSIELRIGNIVDYGQGREPQFITGKDLSEGVEDRPFRAIPLTDEWLTKFGFNSKYKSVHMRWNISSFAIDQKSNEDDEHRIIPQEQVFYFEHMWEIKYVHQLQNLYFALTGEELKTVTT